METVIKMQTKYSGEFERFCLDRDYNLEYKIPRILFRAKKSDIVITFYKDHQIIVEGDLGEERDELSKLVNHCNQHAEFFRTWI